MSALALPPVRTVVTHESKLRLYVGVHAEDMPEINELGYLAPCNVMNVSPDRAWVVLSRELDDAAYRAFQGFREFQRPTHHTSLVMLTFEFTALGFGHYTLADQLVEHRYGHFRFYGDLPLLCSNIDGNMLVSLTEVAG